MADQTVCGASTIAPRAHSLSIAETVGKIAVHAVTTLLDWQQRASQRRELSGLDPSFLKDLGIDQAAAHREASKPFWRE